MTTSPKEVYSCINYGKNNCEICQEDCDYRVTKYWDMANTTMELFRCGHGVCRDCYTKLPLPFKCPFCRDMGRCYKTSTGIDNTNTLREYIREFGINSHLILYTNHIFVRLHKQIYQNKIISLKLSKKIEPTKSQKVVLIKKVYTCPHCSKNKFTSDQQLSIHIKTKHIKN